MSAAVVAPTPLERALRRERALVVGALVVVLAIAWAWIVSGAGMGMTALEMTRLPGVTVGAMDRPMAGAGTMSSHPGDGASASGGMAMDAATAIDTPMPSGWSAGHAALMLSMWWVMMVAMMLPSAAPMILLYASVNRRQRARGAVFVPSGAFAAGYLVAWGVFSAVAVVAQWWLDTAGLLSMMMESTSAVLGGTLLVAAGAWQLTPVKRACLEHCRAPVEYLSRRWRPGHLGALRMGAEHGAYCLGCCWFLMGLLFFGGVMNLVWIAGLAAYVLAEKTLPLGHHLGPITGVALLAWGSTLIGRALL